MESSVQTVSAGNNFTCVLVQGNLWCWGANDSCELGRGQDSAADPTPVLVNVGINATLTDLSCGYMFCTARRDNGDILTWGSHTHGKLGVNTASPSARPARRRTSGASCTPSPAGSTAARWTPRGSPTVGDTTSTANSETAPTRKGSNPPRSSPPVCSTCPWIWAWVTPARSTSTGASGVGEPTSAERTGPGTVPRSSPATARPGLRPSPAGASGSRPALSLPAPSWREGACTAGDRTGRVSWAPATSSCTTFRRPSWPRSCTAFVFEHTKDPAKGSETGEVNYSSQEGSNGAGTRRNFEETTTSARRSGSEPTVNGSRRVAP